MKKRNILSIFIIIFVILGLFTACDLFNDEDSKSDYTVKFEANCLRQTVEARLQNHNP